MSTIRITREELYEKLWTSPTTKLAKEFGISDVGLAKICKKYGIPKPSLGYWAKVAGGQKLERAPFPPPPRGTAEIIEIEGRGQKPSIARTEKYPEVYAEFGLINAENVVHERIELLSRLHPLLKESYKYFKSSTPDAYSRFTTGQTPCVGLTVSKPSLERALKLMHTLFRLLETQGFVIEVRKEYRMSTFAVVHEVGVERAFGSTRQVSHEMGN